MLLAGLGLAASTGGGCQCNKTAPTNKTPIPPPEPDTPTPYPTSSIIHHHAYVSQFPTGALFYADLTTTPTYVATVTAQAAGPGGPAFYLAATEDRNTLVEAHRTDAMIHVWDFTSNPVSTLFGAVTTVPPFPNTTVMKFAPPRGPYANWLFMATDFVAAGEIRAYQFSGTGVSAQTSLSIGAAVKVKDFAFTPDGETLVMLGDNGSEKKVYPYQLSNWTLASSGQIGISSSASVDGAIAVHPNGWLVYVPLSPNVLWYYNLYSGRTGTGPRNGGNTSSLIADPAGKWLFLATGNNNEIEVFDTTVTPPVALPHIFIPTSLPNAWAMDFSPATRTLLISDIGGEPNAASAWLCDLAPWEASGGTTAPNFFLLDDPASPGGPPSSHVQFGK